MSICYKTIISISSKKSFNSIKPNKLLSKRVDSSGNRVLGQICSDDVGSNWLPRRNCVKVHFSNGWSSGIDSDSTEVIRKRNVVEHICLLKAKKELSEEEEKDMLDYLYTLQYQMGGIVAISVGCLSGRNPDGYTHALYMRFQRKEDLAKFYKNSFYLGVLEDHVMPYCHELVSVDYESEVEDDILPIFRKGEEFNYGVEFILVISVVEGSLVGCMEDALAALEKLIVEFPSLIVQATQGANLNLNSRKYTHAAVLRFRTSEAFEMFVGSQNYRDMWISKFEPITEKSLAVHFSIEPVGTEIM
ncbi:hypothetical protein IFM89_037392 [Coptis chinensis]|uniref:Stress-response A/B barrel domain-containing protein n=1 Tax=Coptis chinensis TaxID=261450 RepID=A0A835IGM3_9MAGN|nr:hypothetical protein IFM89_037392 [Coptis chinensis]